MLGHNFDLLNQHFAFQRLWSNRSNINQWLCTEKTWVACTHCLATQHNSTTILSWHPKNLFFEQKIILKRRKTKGLTERTSSQHDHSGSYFGPTCQHDHSDSYFGSTSHQQPLTPTFLAAVSSVSCRWILTLGTLLRPGGVVLTPHRLNDSSTDEALGSRCLISNNLHFRSRKQSNTILREIFKEAQRHITSGEFWRRSWCNYNRPHLKSSSPSGQKNKATCSHLLNSHVALLWQSHKRLKNKNYKRLRVRVLSQFRP